MSDLEQAYDELVAKYPDEEEGVQEAARLFSDSSCTSGYDNDGSTGYEIFENGLELGRLVGEDQDVFELHLDGTVCFFIGSDLDEVVKAFVKNVTEYVEQE